MSTTQPSTAKPAVSELADIQLEAVLGASPNAILGVDESGTITYVNPAVEAMFGYSPAELIGRPIEMLLPDSVQARHQIRRDEFVANPTARPMGIGLDLAGRRRDGSHVPVEISLAPVHGADGLRVFATIVDISPRKAAEFELLQAQKLESIGRLAGGIAHDFNNMMFAVRGYADLLREDLAPANLERVDLAEVRSYIDALDQAAERAAALTAQLLAFSRRQVVIPQVMALNDAVAGIEPMIRPLIGEHIELRLQLDPAAGQIQADPGQLDQIVVNLVVNARDALPATGGMITIETATVVFDEGYAISRFELEPGTYVMLSVSDNGAGMSAETRDHIFEPFFTTKQPGQGTGLGLATTHGIVRQAGGHIWVYSEPDHGSVFKLYFPRVDADVVVPVASGVGEAAESGRVLVVEDDELVRDMTVRLLERAGFDVVIADSASAGMLVRAGGVDILLADVVMPGRSGTDLVAEVLVAVPEVAVVLISGYTEHALDLQDLVVRGVVFISKPATLAQLLDAIAQARRLARQRQRAAPSPPSEAAIADLPGD